VIGGTTATIPAMAPIRDIAGQRFGRFTVLSFVEINERHKAVWWCRCDCGTAKRVVGSELTFGKTISCGCWRREKTADAARARTQAAAGHHWNQGIVRSAEYRAMRRARATTHGMTHTREYSSWTSMLQRCTNPNDPSFANYGGRGITVCDRWRRFENFYEDMGPRPLKHSMDRIDNSLGYFKENCRWAPDSVQAANKRTNRILSFGGRSQTLAEWAREVGVQEDALRRRLGKSGWTVEKALTTPLRRQRKPIRKRRV
jgi:hypothetical protein